MRNRRKDREIQTDKDGDSQRPVGKPNISKETDVDIQNKRKDGWLVSWCFERCQPLGIIAGQKERIERQRSNERVTKGSNFSYHHPPTAIVTTPLLLHPTNLQNSFFYYFSKGSDQKPLTLSQLAQARTLGVKQNVCCVRMAFSYSNLLDVTNSNIEIPEAEVQLPEW